MMPKTFGTVIERDLGFNRIRDTFLKAGDPVVKVGIQGKDATDLHGDFGGGARPLTNLEVGVIHEFGAPGVNIPERSFIRAPVKRHAAKYYRRIQLIVKAAITGVLTVKKGLGLLGIEVESDMKNAMQRGIPPPLKRRRRMKKTQKRKGRQVPLIDTKQLFNSITYVVTKAKR